MSFVQADPIRSPARAQDLILRHRVKAYRAGQLENLYPDLDIEEDILYAYGFLPRRVWQSLQPRKTTGLGALEKRVLEAVKQFGEAIPENCRPISEGAEVLNDWGGYSAATTRTLERLRHHGLLRIARRDRGTRIYELARPHDLSLTSDERLRKLIPIIAGILAPVRRRVFDRRLPAIAWGNPRAALETSLRNGELERKSVDGMPYVWPAVADRQTPADLPRQVRLLAPFDPLVWDRRRFEHLWGWAYRFEAYTPTAKRVRGYYAMPMLWGDVVIGWANVRVHGDRMSIEPGFVSKPPPESPFRSELERETESLRAFLNLGSTVSTSILWP